MPCHCSFNKLASGLQALFAEDTETKLPAQIAKRKLILQAVGDDAPSQMAQLLALEYLTGVTDTDKLTQVSSHSCNLLGTCMPRLVCTSLGLHLSCSLEWPWFDHLLV